MKKYQGVPSAKGLACAVAATVTLGVQCAAETLAMAVEACAAKQNALYEKALKEVGEENAEIFSVYAELVQDECLMESIDQRVAEGTELTQAIAEVVEEMAAVFRRAKSEYMRQRAEDIRNVGTMLIQQLEGRDVQFQLPPGEERFIIVAENLTPADTMLLDKSRLVGMVTKLGGATSHVVILAKALGIPAITGVSEVADIAPGQTLVMDGATGELLVDPDEVTWQQTLEKLRQQEDYREMLRQMPKGEVYTLDGKHIHVSVNIGTSDDLKGLSLESIFGVGLYRTEFLFAERAVEPTLQEQIEEYRKVFDALEGKDLIVRTLDIGGDKKVPYLNLPSEENPFLGCRGIRLCFAREGLFRTQIEALLRAAAGRPFSVMFPMVNDVAEFVRAKSIWQSVQETVDVPVSRDIQLGVMIETPAAMLCADILAQYVDFASIGTNDLTQYMLAADRGNPDTGIQLSHYAPAVIRAIYQAVHAFHEAGVKISVCGEAGSDVHFLPLMIAMGLRYVSVTGSMVDEIRYTITNTHCGEQARLLEQVLRMTSRQEIYEYLHKNEPAFQYYCTMDEGKRQDAAGGHWSYPMLGEEHGCTHGCMSGISVYANTEFIPPAVHDFQEGFLVLEGTGTARVGSQTFSLEPRMSFIVPKGMSHSLKSSSPRVPLTLFWFHAYG